MLKVIGHISPDTDTTCSAISYAWFLKEVKSIDATPYVLGGLNKETQFVLKHFNLKTPEILEKITKDDSVVIVDTNNPEELLKGINEAQIEGIVDHHKLVGGLTTQKPIDIRIEPIACTATIIWNIIKESQKENSTPKEIAGIMLAAILSDTLKFTSPTTTEKDKTAANELSQICGEEIESLSGQMFDAKSDLTGMSIKDILNADSKVFDFGDKKARISVLETTKPDNALSMKEEIKSEMQKIKTEENSDYMFFFVIDILKTEASLIVSSDEEKEISQKAFSLQFNEDLLHLPGVVSRKKQIIPSLEPAIKA